MESKHLESGSGEILLRIHNQKKPDQVIQLVWNKAENRFQTQGFSDLFGVKEIVIDSQDALRSLERYAHVLSFLLETISAAEDMKLPYAFQNEFEFGSEHYTLYEHGDYRVLRQLEEKGRRVPH